MRSVWAGSRSQGRFGAIVEPMLQWAKTETVLQRKQVIPCKAGVMSGVVYANGDVSLCETHKPIGNLRNSTFREIWNSTEAKGLRARIKARECWCTNEVFMWPSIVFQPLPLARSMIGGRVWKEPEPVAKRPAGKPGRRASEEAVATRRSEG